ncbi:MAG TPA: M55 family metallopeptidase [Vicinamibacterales bacterium]|nr:M55 family metallopeptidase [Vicinamibacterales bacterium]HPW19982.1 M55 family metallopeptidase [Vicinamibacterales bacterium]
MTTTRLFRARLGAPRQHLGFPAAILLLGGPALFALACGPGASAPAERPPLKIYVNTDLEGVSGVFKFAQTREKDSPLNIQACEYFMGDVAAVVRGLRDAGATEVVVLDGHGTQAVLPHLMAPGAVYVTGTPRPGAGNLSGLDESFAGMVMLGFHAMMGTPDGVLNHTQSSRSENRYWYNGVESGELVQNAAIAGHYGVPLVMVTGDEATCREARQFFGDGVVTVATKRGLSREAAVLYPFEETRKALYDGARRAVEATRVCKPYVLKAPIAVREEYLNLDPSLPAPVKVVREGVAENALQLFTWANK